MTSEEQLIKSRNLIRWLIRKMDKELDIRFRDGSYFFEEFTSRCEEIGVIKKDRGRCVVTSKEQENWHKGKPRHRGRHFA